MKNKFSIKNILISVTIQISFFQVLNAQDLLNSEWKFKTGDSIGWAQPAYDDCQWKHIEASNLWENQGYEDYDGFASK